MLLQQIFNSSSSLVSAKILTVASIGLFAGQALAYNAIIMPALRSVSPETALPIWAKSYAIGKNMQVCLILTSVLAGLPVYHRTQNVFFLIGPLMMASIIPFTMAFIMPVNHTLLDILDGKGDGKKGGAGNLSVLYNKWDLLHFGRTVLSLGALGLTLYGSFSRHALTMFN
ncbi:hypothetical protein BGZ95_011410 [Linnemannia exigua]|uniref:DUF1772-domain-containing protein n=1 Tax=Linnemannia exigua TaxID=604196 RepID=A0AAD4DAG8_9FUNG|nr:hypothetical protein BGZ95_011410 [Linnemannia exigua]